MIKYSPQDKVNMDISFSDLYKIYFLIGHCNNSQFEGYGGEGGIFSDIEDKFDKNLKLYKEQPFAGATISERLKKLNAGDKDFHLTIFNKLFNKDFISELEELDAEIDMLETKLAYIKVKKLNLTDQP
jgi:hypothetical protein